MFKVRKNGSTESFGTAFGGIMTLITITLMALLVAFYIINYLENPPIQISQTTRNYQQENYTGMPSWNKTFSNKEFEVIPSQNASDFDIALFFPDAYNNTLDLLMNGSIINAWQFNSLYQAAGWQVPFNIQLSRFILVLTDDQSNQIWNQTTFPMTMLGTTQINFRNGRVYGAPGLNTSTFGANFRLEMLMEIIVGGTPTTHAWDFTPYDQQNFPERIYLLYRDYQLDYEGATTSDTIFYNYVNMLPAFNPPDGTGVGQCNGMVVTANVIEFKYHNAITMKKTLALRKFSDLRVVATKYSFADYVGQCPQNNFSWVPSPAGLTSHLYQPFYVQFVGSKLKNVYTFTMGNIVELISAIGGIILLVLCFFCMITRPINTLVYEKDLAAKEKNSASSQDLASAKYKPIVETDKTFSDYPAEFDDHQKLVLNYTSRAKEDNNLPSALENLRQRKNPQDKKVLDSYNEAVKFDEHQQKLYDFIHSGRDDGKLNIHIEYLESRRTQADLGLLSDYYKLLATQKAGVTPAGGKKLDEAQQKVKNYNERRIEDETLAQNVAVLEQRRNSDDREILNEYLRVKSMEASAKHGYCLECHKAASICSVCEGKAKGGHEQPKSHGMTKSHATPPPNQDYGDNQNPQKAENKPQTDLLAKSNYKVKEIYNIYDN
jgi:hypothetical protein